MKNVLLLTDFTPKSHNAHQYAFQFFKGQECTFHLLSIQKIWEYTMDDLIIASPKSDVETALLGDNRSQVAALVDSYSSKGYGDGFTFKGHVDYDVFTDAVAQAVGTYAIDLVICGTDGKTGIVETIFSSHTLRIIRKVDCPVLVIPEDYAFKSPSNVRYLLDYDDVFEMCGKEPLIEVVRAYKATIDVLRLTFGYDMEPKECGEERRAIQLFFPSNPVSYHTYIDQDPVRVIQIRQQKEPAQLQVLSAHKQTFLERMFSNSHLSQIVNTATVPLLILRDCNS